MAVDKSNRAGRREWLGLAVIALPCMLYSMDLTVLDLAVPRLSASLQPTAAQLLWIVDIYGFMVAGSLITMGTLGDRIGRRRLLMIGAAAFGVASVLAAFSTSAEMLIATRALLGLAGATLAPSTLSLIRSMFLDAQERTTAIGIWVAGFSVGAAIGPVLGGLVLEYFWWGAGFLIGVPVMLLLLALGPVLLPEYRDPNAGRLDVVSAGLSMGAVLSAIYGLKRIAEDGLQAIPVIAVIAGVVIAFAFVRRQLALPQPLIDLSLFRSPALSGSLLLYMFGTFVVFAAYIYIAQYLQLVLGLSPLRAGLFMVPAVAAFIVGSMLVPAIVRRVRPPYVIAGGLVVGAAGFAVLTMVDGPNALAVIVAGSVIYSFGTSPVVILATDLVVGSAPMERAGAASAISETSSELGGALGIAILGSVGTAVYRSAMATAVPPGLSTADAAAAKATLGAAVGVASRLSDGAGAALLEASRGAFAQGFEMAMGICAAIALLGAAGAVVLLRHVPVGSAHAADAPVPAEGAA